MSLCVEVQITIEKKYNAEQWLTNDHFQVGGDVTVKPAQARDNNFDPS